MVVLNVYMIHSKKLTLREAVIEKLKDLASKETILDVKVHVVDDHEPESININNIKNLVKLDKLPEEDNQFYQPFVRQLSLEILSNIFNHFKAIQIISKNDPTEYNLIVEDDVQFSSKIFTQITTLINNVKTMEWDMIFLGQPSERPKEFNNQLTLTPIEEKDNMVLHCIDSYLVSSQTAKDLMVNFFPIRFGYNIQLSYLIDKYKYKCWKIFPNICGDGSKMGEFTSSILMNNVLIFNDLYKQIYVSLENSDVLSDETVKEIEQKFEENIYKENPDFVYLEALFYKKQNKIEKSEELFREAMRLYEINNTPMNNTSTFLKNYIDLYRIKQKN